MSATATQVARSVSRVYGRADGSVAVLSYRERGGRHVVRYQGPGDEGLWPCETIEGARARWRVLERRLLVGGFKRVEGS